MKARFYTSTVFGLALSALTLLTGCTEDDAGQAGSLISSANAEPAITAVSTSPSAELSPTAVPAPAPAEERKLPASLKPSTPAGEVIKLAQSGVDETVMLTYITNASGAFNLSSDDIIYLNDLGVANTVVTGMMQHDQAVRSYWANQTPAAPSPTAAPTYLNPPQPEPQPAPIEAAPVQPPQPAPAANVTYNYFNDSLAPYGTWVEVEGYGRCWQPTVAIVNRSWQPYSDRGHWVYTDSGWYWMSDYSWGWAPFHYGRWFSHPSYGWCWWPDRVWGPSWVSWRYSDAYCGWAPLPPAAYYRTGFGFSYYGGSVGLSFDFGLGASSFTFVSWNNFCDSRPWHHRVPLQQVTQVFNNTTIVNNYRTDSHNTVINQGIPTDRIRERTRNDLRPVAIREHNDGDGRGGRGERLEHDGRTLVVRRPRIPESATPQQPTLPRGRAETDIAHTPGGGAGAIALKENNHPRGGSRNAEVTRERDRQSTTPTGPVTVQRPGTTPPPPPMVGNTRTKATEHNAEATRERGRQPGNPTPATTATAPVAPSTPPFATALAANPTPANPFTRDNRGTPRTQEDQRDNSGRERKRDGSQTPTTLPAVATSPAHNTATVAPTVRTAPPGSLVVIGRRDQNSAPATQSPRVQTPGNTARNSYNWSPPANPTLAPQQMNSPTPRSAPAQSFTPAPSQPNREERRYTAPSQPSYSAPQPSYTAPRPSAPSYSAPAPVQRSQPSQSSAPAYRAPAPAPAPSYSPPARSQSSETRSSPPSSDRGNGHGGGGRGRPDQ